MSRLLLFLIFSLFASGAYAGPFGINMGQPLSQLDLGNKIDATGHKFFLNSVPKPHVDFITYSVFATDETGVCSIVAFSKKYNYGLSVISSMSRFATALEKNMVLMLK